MFPSKLTLLFSQSAWDSLKDIQRCAQASSFEQAATFALLRFEWRSERKFAENVFLFVKRGCPPRPEYPPALDESPSEIRIARELMLTGRTIEWMERMAILYGLSDPDQLFSEALGYYARDLEEFARGWILAARTPRTTDLYTYPLTAQQFRVVSNKRTS